MGVPHTLPDVAESTTAPAPSRRGGPRTEEGKERSRRNALKHGLRSRILLPDDLAAAVAARTVDFADEFAPDSPYEHWLVGQVALAATRLDRCAELGLADLRRRIERAELCWDDDRRAAVEDLGARLAKDPARVARALAQSRQGADWLIERWEALGAILGHAGSWDDPQRRLACDLLGIPPELRTGRDPLPPRDAPEALATLVARQVARLRDDQEAVLDELDDSERAMTAAGMPLDEDAPTTRLRRYEASCRRDLHRALAELGRSREPDASAPAEPSARAALPPPARVLAPPAPVPRPKAIAPIPAPVASADHTRSPLPSSPPPALNRRARRALEKQSRRGAVST